MCRRTASRSLVASLAALSLAATAAPARRAEPPPPSPEANLLIPRNGEALRFAVIGDSGTGNDNQFAIGARMAEYHRVFPFEFVLMLGDNIYGADSPETYRKRFEDPYRVLLDAGVRFYAALGNHDDPNQRYYKQFHMNGERYYTFKTPQSVRFFALDSNYMDPDQIDWLEKELKASGSDWKICFFHHPIYSSGKRHGSDLSLRSVIELVLVENGVDVVLAGHEHFYERLVPQNGIAYFVSGGAGKLRKGNIRRGGATASGYDRGFHFMLMAIQGDDLYFQAINERGQTIDSGILRRRERGGLAEGKGEVEVVNGIPRPPIEAAKPPSPAGASDRAAAPDDAGVSATH